ncbi:hypothetical protein FRX31_030704 [Thalictrum thalictroides]|uniref:WRC domain-containing protein n=1 Tax=Thalictrum thalictroides TaxID=46969 RepID=A0A7J6V3T0_THATH|nr:hypothetical protein FRX31_030704 [Thalictrum thalictroides]
MSEVESEGEEQDLTIPPDQFRCVRTDGKQWRCRGWQYQDSTYCEDHHIKIKYRKKVNKQPKGKKPQLQVKKKPHVQKKNVQIEYEDYDEQEAAEVKFCRKRRKVNKENYTLLDAFLDSSEEEEEEIEQGIPLAKKRNENVKNMNSLVEVKKEEKKTNVQIQENEEKIAKVMNVQVEEEENEEEEKLVRKRRKVATESYVISDSSEGEVREEIPLEKKINESNENMNSTVGVAELSLVEATQLISVVKEIEECTPSELVFALKTAFRYEDFVKVEHILKMREEKIILEKKDAEEQAARFKQILAISGIKCAQLSNELHEKKKEITVVEGKLKESELRKLGIESELLQYKRMCEEFQCVKSRAENEIDGLKKRVKELETQAEEGKKSCSKDSKSQSENNNALKGACLSHVKVKEEALDCDERVHASANVDSICHSPSRDCGVAKHAESEVEHGRKDKGLMTLQLDGSCSKMLSPRKFGTVRPASEGSSAKHHSLIHTVSTEGGNLEESLTSLRRRLVCMRQPEDVRSGAQTILLNHFEISGTSCKELESSTAENGKEEAENFGSTRIEKSLDAVVSKNGSNGSSKGTNSSDPEYVEDGITKFLSALRRAKNSNLEPKEIMKVITRVNYGQSLAGAVWSVKGGNWQMAYKVFSRAEMDEIESLLDQIFRSHLYYVNAFENAASTMETSAVAAENVALTHFFKIFW